MDGPRRGRPVCLSGLRAAVLRAGAMRSWTRTVPRARSRRRKVRIDVYGGMWYHRRRGRPGAGARAGGRRRGRGAGELRSARGYPCSTLPSTIPARRSGRPGFWRPDARTRSSCPTATRAADRSPCGSGTKIMALLHARGELDLGERFSTSPLWVRLPGSSWARRRGRRARDHGSARSRATPCRRRPDRPAPRGVSGGSRPYVARYASLPGWGNR